MPIITSPQAEEEALSLAAKLLAASLRTAPKTRGEDSLSIAIATGEEKDRLAEAMEGKAQEGKSGIPAAFRRNAEEVRRTPVVLLVGVDWKPKKIEKPLDCGACGFESCRELMAAPRREGLDFRGPTCVWQAVDLGIALASAAKEASDLNIDNRMMFTLGSAAKELGYVKGELALGLPLSAYGKNIYFDHPG